MPRYRKDYRRLRRDPRSELPDEPQSGMERAEAEAPPRDASPHGRPVQPPAASFSAQPSFEPPTQPLTRSPRSCPACGERFLAESGAILSERCPGCGREWFEGELFRLHLQGKRPALRQEDVSSALLLAAHEPMPGLACPIGDHGPLRASHWEGVPLALCTVCESVLLSPGAFEDLDRRNRAARRRDTLRFLAEMVGHRDFTGGLHGRARSFGTPLAGPCPACGKPLVLPAGGVKLVACLCGARWYEGGGFHRSFVGWLGIAYGEFEDTLRVNQVGNDPSWTCPACRDHPPLAHTTWEGETVVWCPRCTGILVEAGHRRRHARSAAVNAAGRAATLLLGLLTARFPGR